MSYERIQKWGKEEVIFYYINLNKNLIAKVAKNIQLQCCGSDTSNAISTAMWGCREHEEPEARGNISPLSFLMQDI